MKSKELKIIGQLKDQKTTMARWGTCLLILVSVVFLYALPVLGQTPDEPTARAESDYTLTWWSVDGGGGDSVGSGDYTLSSTAGQHDADVVTEGEYTLSGGFWAGGADPIYSIYLPVMARTFSSGGTNSLAPGHYIYLPVITRSSP